MKILRLDLLRNAHMNLRRVCLASAAVLLCTIPSRSQMLFLKDYTVRDGLPDSRVSPVLQDRKGYLWCGTQAGLTRYDGNEFVNFGPAREIPGIFGRWILEDHAGALWLAYSGFDHGGITRVDDSLTIDCTNGLAGVQVTQVAEDARHDFWAATSAGLEHIRFSDTTRARWSVETFPDSMLMMVHTDTDGRIWYAGSGGLFVIDGGSITQIYSPPAGNRDWQIRPNAFYTAHDGSLWLGGYHGAYRIQGSHITKFTGSDGVPDQGVWCFREDADGMFYAGTMKGLCRVIRSGTGFRFVKVASFGDAVVYDMCVDREANLWFASAPGLRRLIRTAEPVEFPAGGALANAGIGPIGQDMRGTLYLGSRNTGLYALRGSALRRVEPGGHSLTRTVTSVLPEPGGTVWVGLWRMGLCAVRGNGYRLYSRGNGFPSDNVGALARGPGGLVIAGTSSGVACIRGDGSLVRRGNVLEGLTVFDIQWRPGDTLWAATNEGVRALTRQGDSLAIIPPGPVERATAGRIVYAILADSRGRLWFGTDGAGVMMRSARGLTAFSTEDGLAGSRVFALAEDSLGSIWIGTSSGLSCYDGRGFRNLGYDEGFGEIGLHGLMTDGEGDLYVSSYPGVRKLRPTRSPESAAPPPLYLIDVRVDARHLSPGERNELPPDPAVITFRFAALSFTDERLVRYRYRLEGFDADWSPQEAAREVRYTHLPPGRYTFAVVGRSADGVWNETPATCSFTILPPVWARWWFVACALLLVAGSAYALYRYRLGRLLELERTRSRIAMDLHDDIGSSLTRISVMTEVAARRSDGNSGDAKQALASVGDTARELIESLGDIVWTVDPKQDTLQNVIRRISQFGQEMCEGSGIGFETDLSGSFEATRLSPERRRDIYLVFKEGIHNIVKHSGATRARFTARATAHGAMLELIDNGTGIPTGAGADGHGLRSLHERGSRAGTRFALTSRNGGGTHIQLELRTG